MLRMRFAFSGTSMPSASSTARTEVSAWTVVQTPQMRWVQIQASRGSRPRGIELILRGRDPREAWIWTQRICGVCTTVHALTSVRAVEDALGIEVPENANLIRNIIGASQYVQDHVIHFYHLHALDWVDVTLALKADPAKTSQLPESISPWPKSSRNYFKGVQDKVKALVESKQLSLFSSGY